MPMQFITARQLLDQGDVVVVVSDTQCNVRIFDDANFRAFTSGRRATYYGGFYRAFPASITVPSTGYWNVVLDVGPGRSANIRYSIRYITP